MSYFSGSKFIKLALISSLLMGASIPAMADNVLMPKSNWSTSKMSGSSEQNIDDYCAMARRYEQNTILIIAQNKGNEKSFAIDFQSPALNKNKDYNVNLSVSSGEKRSFSVLPVSANALVVKVGHDDAFISAMKASYDLMISIDGKKYNFDISDVTSSLNDLGSCVAKLKNEINTAKLGGKKIIGTDHSPDRGADNSLLYVKLNSLKAENKRLLGRISSLSSNASKINEAEQIASSLQVEVNKLKSRNAQLQSNVNGLSDAANAQQEMQKLIDILYSEKENISLNLIRAKEQIAFIKSAPQAKMKIAALENDVEALEIELTNSSIAEQKQRLKLDAKRNELIESNMILSSENSKLSKMIETLSVELQGKNESQKKKTFELDEKRNLLLENNTSLVSENNKLSKVINDINNKYVLLEQAYKDLSGNKNIEDNKKSEQLVTLKNTIDKLEKEIFNTMSDRNDVNAEKQVNIDVLNSDIESYRVENKRLETVIDAIKTDLHNTTEIVDNINIENNKLVSALQDQINTLENGVQQNDEKNKEYINQILELETLNNSKIFNSADIDNKILDLEASIVDLNFINRELVDKLSAKEQEISAAKPSDITDDSNVKGLEVEISILRKDNLNLINDLDIANSKVKNLALNDSADENKINSFRRKIKDLKSALNISIQSNKDINDELKRTINNYEDQVLKLSNPESELQKNISRLHEAEREIRRMANNIEKQKESFDLEKREMEYMLFDPELASLAQISLLHALEDKISANSIIIDEKNETIAGYKKEVEDLSRKELAIASKPIAIADRSLIEVSKISSSLDYAPVSIRANEIVEFIAMDEMKNLLDKSGVDIDDTIEVNSGSSEMVSYSWYSKGIFGKVEQRKLSDGNNFLNYVNAYIGNIKNKCNGEFAAVDNEIDLSNLSSYEVVCMTDSLDSAISALFSNGNGLFTVVTHESSADRMEETMVIRDNIMSSFSGI